MAGFLKILWLLGANAGSILGVSVTVISIVVCLFVRPKTITAQAYRAERLAGRSLKPGEFEPDGAWPLYPFRQARTDLAQTSAEVGPRQKLPRPFTASCRAKLSLGMR